MASFFFFWFPAEATAPTYVPPPVVHEEKIETDEGQFCNCYLYIVETSGYPIPMQSEMKPSTDLHEGAIAIFDYDGLPHVAFVLAVGEDTFTVREANYDHCKEGTRVVRKDDSALLGFWFPG